MTEDLLRQSAFWDRESSAFNAIYTHRKSRFANWLDRVFRRDIYDRFGYALKNARPIEGRSILDVGCGTGIYMVELAKQGATSLTGLDVAPEMLRISHDRARTEGVLSKCKFIRSDILTLKDTQRFDITIGMGLFDYIKAPLPVIRAMRHLTIDRAIMSFPRLWTWRAPLRKLRLALKGCPVHFYTRAKIERALGLGGFKRWQIDKLGKSFCVVAWTP